MTSSGQRVLIGWLQAGLIFSAGGLYAQNRASAKSLSEVRLQEIVRVALGEGISIYGEMRPRFIVGDFNGDNRRDLALVVDVEASLSRITSGLPVSDLSTSDLSPLPPGTSGHHCLGLAIIHDVDATTAGVSPVGRQLFYGCFSSWRLVRKSRAAVLARGAIAQPRGDALILDLESGGVLMLYSDGVSYHAYIYTRSD